MTLKPQLERSLEGCLETRFLFKMPWVKRCTLHFDICYDSVLEWVFFIYYVVYLPCSSGWNAYMYMYLNMLNRMDIPNELLWAGGEVHTTNVNFFGRLHNCLCKRMASLPCFASKHSPSGDFGWDHGDYHVKNVKPWATSLCRSWKCSRTNSWSN